MPLILGTNSIKDTGFNVDNSVRFNAADSPSLKIAIGSGATNTKKFTFSGWFKKCTNVTGTGATGAAQTIFDINGTNTGAYFNDDHDQFTMNLRNEGATNYIFKTNRKFRDNSAWLHIVVAIDTTQATEGNRVTVYFNGVEETSWAEENYPDQNYEPGFNGGTEADFYIGAVGTTKEFNGYIAEVVCIDGTKYAASDFGEFDEDSPRIWKPKDVSGLTFGNKGFYLDFKASGNLGNDANGGTDLTEANLAATDQSTDTCKNNFATLNFLDNYYSGATLSEGNLLQVTDTHTGSSSGESSPVISTIGVSSGKWYSEVKFVSTAEHDYIRVGVTSNQTGPGDGTAVLGNLANSYGLYFNSGDLYDGNGGTATSYGSAIGVGDIVGIYLDLDNNKLYFSDNGSLISSTGISITDPASTNLGFYFFGGSDESRNTATLAWNYGGCPAFAISSGNTDDNGYGNFEYSPNITGDSVAKKFYSLNSKNLAEYG